MAAKKLLAICATTLAVLLSLANGVAAIAHTELQSSEPAAGSSLEIQPDEIVLNFGDKILVLDGAEDSNQILVSNSKKSAVQQGTAVVNGRQISVKLKSNLKSGTYTVAYRVVSVDGHPIEGAFKFELNLPGSTAEIETSADSVSAEQISPVEGNQNSSAIEEEAATQNDGEMITRWISWILGTLVFLGVSTGAIIAIRRKS